MTTKSLIADYSMPTAEAFPSGPARWVPHPDRSILLVHDMQNYFVEFLAAELRESLIDHVAVMRRAARRMGVPVAYTAQPGSMSTKSRGRIIDFWGPGMEATPEHRSIVDRCAPLDGDIVEDKWRYSAFYGNELSDRLAATRRDQLVVCGVFASIGCQASSIDAFSKDYETFFVGDAVADFTETDHLSALSYVARTCAVVTGYEDVVEKWIQGGPHVE